MAGFLAFNNRLPSLDSDWNIPLIVRLQLIYSHSWDCTRVPWESLKSMVISLALVNGSHHWPVIKWFLPCSTSNHCNHMDRIILCRRWDEDPRYVFKALIAFPQVTMEFYISTFVWSWLCSNLRMYDIDLHCMTGSYFQVWVLYHMDLAVFY